MNDVPKRILETVRKSVESARLYVRESGRTDSSLHYKLREASETLAKMISLLKSPDEPFWYTLYEGLVEKYIHIRTENRRLREKNRELKKEYEYLKDRYWDAISRLKEEAVEAEKL